MFEIPIVLFIFKRVSSLEQIISRINEICPKKVYLVADGGRNELEHNECLACRAYAESLFLPNIEIIKNYSSFNRGVFQNIGLGAKWVFETEDRAIFLEDDNLPALSFFTFCESLLEKYANDDRIMWICGTNYLGEFNNGYSYVFTRHMLPCGWASWSKKFNTYYDGYLNTIFDKNKLQNFKKTFLIRGCSSKKLYYSSKYALERTKYLVDNRITEASWDYQMNYSIRSNMFYGISPSKNQINNIGVDNCSIHGGNVSKGAIKAYCFVEEKNIEMPLVHPPAIEIDKKYEKKINNIIASSWSGVIKNILAKPLKKLVGINEYDSFSKWLKKKKNTK